MKKLILILVTHAILNSCIWATGGHQKYRLFDIVKPWPARQLEGLPEGWGILADDLMAGVYAGAALWGAAVLFMSN